MALTDSTTLANASPEQLALILQLASTGGSININDLDPGLAEFVIKNFGTPDQFGSINNIPLGDIDTDAITQQIVTESNTRSEAERLTILGVAPTVGSPGGIGLPGSDATNALSSSLALGAPTGGIRSLFSTSTLGGGGGDPIATGFPLLERTLNLLFEASNQRRANVLAQFSILQTLADLEQVSPAKAAEARFGLGDRNAGQPLANLAETFQQGGLGISGSIGGSDIQLANSLSGRNLTKLQSNPTSAFVLGDISKFLGDPDLLSRSIGNAIPTSQGLLGGIFGG